MSTEDPKIVARQKQVFQNDHFELLRMLVGHRKDDTDEDSKLDKRTRGWVLSSLRDLLPMAYTSALRDHVENWPGWNERLLTDLHQGIYHEHLGFDPGVVSANIKNNPSRDDLFFGLHFCTPEGAIQEFELSRKAALRQVGPKLIRLVRLELEGGDVPPFVWHDLAFLLELNFVVKLSRGIERFLLLEPLLAGEDEQRAKALASQISAGVRAKAPGAPEKSRDELRRLWNDWMSYYEVVEEALPETLSLESIIESRA